jgi:ThiF family
MLAQAGVDHLRLVDPDSLGWENIRRHELGANHVGHGKAKSLANSIRAAQPLIGFVEGYQITFATFAREHPEALEHTDLIISCTGDWTADASVEHALTQPGREALAVYGWMEGHALASHPLLLSNAGARLAHGFNEHGDPRLPVVAGGKPPPPDWSVARIAGRMMSVAHVAPRRPPTTARPSGALWA